MSRLPLLPPSEMNESQKAYHEVIMNRPNSRDLPKDRPLVGPFNAWARSPVLGNNIGRTVTYLRSEESGLNDRLAELAIITVGRIWSAEFEFAAHAPMAVRAGVDEAIVEAVRNGQAPDFTNEDERAVYNFTMALTGDHRVDDATYAAALEQLGEAALVELIGLMGTYVTVCMTLNAFEVAPPEGQPRPFPEQR